MSRSSLWLMAILIIAACAVKPEIRLSKEDGPPDYRQSKYWAALPEKQDSADAVPSDKFEDQQLHSDADIFFIHPTTYTGKKGHDQWNAPIDDPDLIARTDRGTILHQASIFNASGRIYAPRYRQAHIYSYFDDKNPEYVNQAFDLAYHDIKNAFEYYLMRYHNGRPIIIASHSQGTTHAIRLIREYFDNKALQTKLIAAYLVGMPLLKSTFDSIPICESPEEVGCYCAWRTFRRGYLPKKRIYGDSIAVTNPLNWTTNQEYVSSESNLGGVLRDYHDGIHPGLTDAQISNGILWASKPKFPGSFFFQTKNYHIGDYNLFWLNVRQNALLRTNTFLAEGD